MKPYQFSIVRYIHDISTGEFANVGVILYSADSRSLRFRIAGHTARLSRFFEGFDRWAYSHMARALEDDLTEAARAPQVATSLESLLRRLLPPDAAGFQVSPVLGGVADDHEALLHQIFADLTGLKTSSHAAGRKRRDEAQVERTIERVMGAAGVLTAIATRSTRCLTARTASRPWRSSPRRWTRAGSSRA